MTLIMNIIRFDPNPFNTNNKQHSRHEWDLKLQTLERVQGRHAVFRKRMDTAILRQFRRLPGVGKSEFVGLDTYLGTDTEIDVEDVLNDPFLRPERKIDTHMVMESYYKV